MADNQKLIAGLQTGDIVALSKTFLQATGQHTGNAPFGRGLVTAIERLGDTQLALIEWDRPEIPNRVNIANLSLVKNGVVLELD